MFKKKKYKPLFESDHSETEMRASEEEIDIIYISSDEKPNENENNHNNNQSDQSISDVESEITTYTVTTTTTENDSEPSSDEEEFEADIDVEDEMRTRLITATKAGQSEILAQAKLENKDLKFDAIEDEHGRSLPVIAMIYDQYQTLKFMIKEDQRPDIVIENLQIDWQNKFADANFLGKGITLAHYAAYYNDKKALRILKKAGANFDAPDDKGLTPLVYAILNTSRKATKFLLRQNVALNKHIVGTFRLPNNINVSIVNPAEIHLAIISGSRALVKKLIAKNIDLKIKVHMINQGYSEWLKPAQLANFCSHINIEDMIEDKLRADKKMLVSLLQNLGHFKQAPAQQLPTKTSTTSKKVKLPK